MAATDPDSLGARIRSARRDRDISQEELARQAGTTVGTMSRYERNEIEAPGGQILSAIAAALGVSERWLTTGREEPVRAATPDPEHWSEFLENYEHLDEISKEDLEGIKNFAGRIARARSWRDFEWAAERVRTSKLSPTFEEKRKGRGR